MSTPTNRRRVRIVEIDSVIYNPHCSLLGKVPVKIGDSFDSITALACRLGYVVPEALGLYGKGSGMPVKLPCGVVCVLETRRQV